MSQWVGMARTNYVAVEDIKGLRKSLKRFGVELERGQEEQKNKWAMFGLEDGWPSIYDEEKEEDIFFSFKEHVMPYVKEGEVLIAMEAGYSRSQYLTGVAVAYQRQKAKVSGIRISLSDIYARAKHKFKVKAISEAMY